MGVESASFQGFVNDNRFETYFDANSAYYDGAHGIGVQKVTSNCNVATLISFVLYLVRLIASHLAEYSYFTIFSYIYIYFHSLVKYMKTVASFQTSIHVRISISNFVYTHAQQN